ncbi:hypothetical protein C0J52_18590 [Blattella germanica]|nr:hypothetical protein C0J52_18590 [Blattella germanica]
MNIMNWIPFIKNRKHCSDPSETRDYSSEHPVTRQSTSAENLPRIEVMEEGIIQPTNENQSLNIINANLTQRKSPDSEVNIVTENRFEVSQNTDASRNALTSHDIEFSDKNENHSLEQTQTSANALLAALKCKSSPKNRQNISDNSKQYFLGSSNSESSTIMRPVDLPLGQNSMYHSGITPEASGPFINARAQLPLANLDNSKHLPKSLSYEYNRNFESSGSLQDTRGYGQTVTGNHPYYVSPVTTPGNCVSPVTTPENYVLQREIYPARLNNYEKYVSQREISSAQLNNYENCVSQWGISSAQLNNFNGGMVEIPNNGYDHHVRGHSTAESHIPRAITSRDRSAPAGLSMTNCTSFNSIPPYELLNSLNHSKGTKIQRETYYGQENKAYMDSQCNNGAYEAYPTTHIYKDITSTSKIERTSVTAFSGIGSIRTMYKEKVQTTSETTYSLRSGDTSRALLDMFDNKLIKSEDENRFSHMDTYGTSGNFHSSQSNGSHGVSFSSYNADPPGRLLLRQNDYIVGASTNAQTYGNCPSSYVTQNVKSAAMKCSPQSDKDLRNPMIYSPYNNDVSRPSPTSQLSGFSGPFHATQYERSSNSLQQNRPACIPENHAQSYNVRDFASAPTAGQNYKSIEKISLLECFDSGCIILAHIIQRTPTVPQSVHSCRLAGWNLGVGCTYSDYSVDDDSTTLFSKDYCRTEEEVQRLISESKIALEYYERKMSNNYYLQELVNRKPQLELPTNQFQQNPPTFQNIFDSRTESINGSSQLPSNKNTGPSYSLFANNHEMEKTFDVLCTGNYAKKKNFRVWDSFSQEMPIVSLKCPRSGFMIPMYVDDILVGQIYDVFQINLDQLFGLHYFTIPQDRLAELRNHNIIKEIYRYFFKINLMAKLNRCALNKPISYH